MFASERRSVIYQIFGEKGTRVMLLPFSQIFLCDVFGNDRRNEQIHYLFYVRSVFIHCSVVSPCVGDVIPDTRNECCEGRLSCSFFILREVSAWWNRFLARLENHNSRRLVMRRWFFFFYFHPSIMSQRLGMESLLFTVAFLFSSAFFFGIAWC